MGGGIGLDLLEKPLPSPLHQKELNQKEKSDPPSDDQSQNQSRRLHYNSSTIQHPANDVPPARMLPLRMLNDEMPFHLLPYEIRDEDIPDILFLTFFKGDGKFYFKGALPCEGRKSVDAP